MRTLIFVAFVLIGGVAQAQPLPDYSHPPYSYQTTAEPRVTLFPSVVIMGDGEGTTRHGTLRTDATAQLMLHVQCDPAQGLQVLFGTEDMTWPEHMSNPRYTSTVQWLMDGEQRRSESWTLHKSTGWLLDPDGGDFRPPYGADYPPKLTTRVKLAAPQPDAFVDTVIQAAQRGSRWLQVAIEDWYVGRCCLLRPVYGNRNDHEHTGWAWGGLGIKSEAMSAFFDVSLTPMVIPIIIDQCTEAAAATR